MAVYRGKKKKVGTLVPFLSVDVYTGGALPCKIIQDLNYQVLLKMIIRIYDWDILKHISKMTV